MMHLNSDAVLTIITNLSTNPVAYIYWYIRKVRNFTERCAMKCITTWFDSPHWMTDSKFDLSTLLMSSRVKSADAIFEGDMTTAGFVVIPQHLQSEINIRI